MRVTTGRLLRVRGRDVTVCWSRATLERHYLDHPGGRRDPRERDCWADLLAKAPPVSIDDYEQTSYEAVANTEIHCTIREDPDLHAYDQFVDDRLLICRTADDGTAKTLRLRTCFHKHFGGAYNHVPGDHLARTAEERLLEYSEWFGITADCNRWDVRFHRGH